ncbi:hypothetical protein HMPREF1248_0091 [Coriobacteriaceae bacterium BV3Ac1]|nr:hypothetical protein HMPREF1248_0091 [Coriobacteriaceae bacterium BV3Ac1]
MLSLAAFCVRKDFARSFYALHKKRLSEYVYQGVFVTSYGGIACCM